MTTQPARFFRLHLTFTQPALPGEPASGYLATGQEGRRVPGEEYLDPNPAAAFLFATFDAAAAAVSPCDLEPTFLSARVEAYEPPQPGPINPRAYFKA